MTVIKLETEADKREKDIEQIKKDLIEDIETFNGSSDNKYVVIKLEDDDNSISSVILNCTDADVIYLLERYKNLILNEHHYE